jgi:type I restriction enzyme R subunit
MKADRTPEIPGDGKQLPPTTFVAAADVRSIVGFLTGKTLAAKQIQFVNLIIDYLTQSGWMTPAQLYESPFTDFSPKGVEGVFGSEQVLQLVGILRDIRSRAAV